VSFVAVAGTIYALLALLDPYWRRVQNRVNELEKAGGSSSVSNSAAALVLAVPPSRLVDSLQQLGTTQAETRSKLQKRLAKAGIHDPEAVPRYFVARLVGGTTGAAMAIGAGLAGYVRMDMACAWACVLAGFGAIAPSLW